MRVEFYCLIRYEWKPMSEAENNSVAAEIPFADSSVAVIVPLFPKLPGVRESLASLGTQTRPPNLVVLLDDGTSPEAESLHEVIPDLHVEVAQVEPGPLTSALEALSEYLANFDFLAFLQVGDAYAPERIEKCLAALRQSREGRPLAMAVTGLVGVDGRGRDLPADDPRAAHLERLWAAGRAGAGLADWLGTGHFAGPISNVFLRRDFLETSPLPADAPLPAQALVLLAGLQGLLTVVHEPLLRHYPPPVEREPTPKAAGELLHTQTAVLASLRDRLASSPETRRNLASFHRAAWNSLTGLREDLFQQAILRLASQAPAEDVQTVTAEVLRSREAQTVPAHWAALLDGHDPLDLAGYASALRRTREKLEDALEDNERLNKIAEAAQGSGWVRFGAWLGERSARRMMEMEQEEEASVVPSPAEKSAGEAGETKS
jgi:hypothetical protein